MLSASTNNPLSIDSHQYSAEHYIVFLLQFFPKWISQQAVESIYKQHQALEQDEFQKKFFSIYGQVIPDYNEEKIDQYLQELKNISDEKIMAISAKVSKIVNKTLTKQAANDTAKQPQNNQQPIENNQKEKAEELTLEQIDKCEKIKKEIQPIFDRIVKIRQFFDSNI